MKMKTRENHLLVPSGSLLRDCLPDGADDLRLLIMCATVGHLKIARLLGRRLHVAFPRRCQYIEQTKPKLIVGLGAVPLQAIIGFH